MSTEHTNVNTLAKREDDAIIEATETNTAQASALARAQVEAPYLVALRMPRHMGRVRQKLLAECERSSFAEVAMYSMPRAGGRVSGLSIRFAEAARRAMGNMIARTTVIYDDDDRQVVSAMAVDLEGNSIDEDQIVIHKWVERREPRDGDEVISRRTNSSGKITYKIRAADDDFRMKRRSEAQRAKRNAILGLIPGDILDECKARILATRKLEVERDPDAERKRIEDAFAKLKVPVDELEKYLGHDLVMASPAELIELGAVLVAVSEGESWRDCLAAKTGITPGDKKGDPKLVALRDKIRDKAQGIGKKRAKASAPTKVDQQPARPSEPDADTDEPPPGYEPGADDR